MDDLVRQRQEMVDRQIRARGIADARVLDAMMSVPRHLFVGADVRERAYEDRPLPIGSGQTISQPYIVAYMCEALQLSPGARVLDIGTGSGYAAAVLAELGAKVISVERHPDLLDRARDNLIRAGYGSVSLHQADGTHGLQEQAPYDAILVGAGAPAVPDDLLQQLAPGGRLVIPVGPSRTSQVLQRITRLTDDEFETEKLGDVSFVPLIGDDGWDDTLWTP